MEDRYDLYAKLAAMAPPGCQVRRRGHLDVCDVAIETAAHSTMLMERKHRDDFCKSAVDGRYREQKARQLAAVDGGGGRTSVVWLVEGPLPKWDDSEAEEPPAQ